MSCSAIGRSSVEATNACLIRAVRARRCAGVPRWRTERRRAFLLLLVLLEALDLAALPAFAFFAAEVVCPAWWDAWGNTGTAAIKMDSSPARQRVASRVGRNGEMRTLIYPI